MQPGDGQSGASKPPALPLGPWQSAPGQGPHRGYPLEEANGLRPQSPPSSTDVFLHGQKEHRLVASNSSRRFGRISRLECQPPQTNRADVASALECDMVGNRDHSSMRPQPF